MEVRDVTCTVCGCCCDDLIVEIEDNHIKSVRNACVLSMGKLMDHGERLASPMIRDGGILRYSSLEEALDRAAQILSEARHPLLWGWSLTSNEAVSIGVELAETLGGVIDNNTSICHGPGLIGVHDIVISSSTLGEVKNRADL
ncbi:MAG: formylmethanofuran dehydrogenase subunit B, partial [Candidatus Bathyarchaeia archaeon]